MELKLLSNLIILVCVWLTTTQAINYNEVTTKAYESIKDDPVSTFTCDQEIKGDTGELLVSTKRPLCSFKTTMGTAIIILETDNLLLSASDELQIISGDRLKHFNYEAPYDPGYILIGGEFNEPVLNFKFNNSNGEQQFRIRFYRSEIIPINSDVNNNFKVKRIGSVMSFKLRFQKTIAEMVHIEIDPNIATGTTLGNYLMTQNMFETFVETSDYDILHIQTSIALGNCSGIYSLSGGKQQEIIGPKVFNGSYRCVNIFSTKNGHFDIDFSNFISLTERNDELVIKDLSDRILIDKQTEYNYPGRVVSTLGTNLIVIYDCPKPSGQPISELRLTVRAELQGGILQGSGTLNLSKGVSARYTLVPEVKKFPSLLTSNIHLGTNTSVTLLKGKTSVATFSNVNLPPIVALSSSEPLTVLYSGSQDNKMIFNSSDLHCHQLSQDRAGSFSVAGPQKNPCYWTLASQEDVALSIDINDLRPGGCVEIQSLDASKPVFKRCDIGAEEVLPTFVLRQAYVTVNLPNNATRFEASLSAIQSRSTTSRVTSLGYPKFYPIAPSKTEVYSFNGTGKVLVFTLNEFDLRDGEEFQINSQSINNNNRMIIGDVIVNNATASITIKRPVEFKDLSLRRGYNVSVSNFKSFRTYVGNSSTKNSEIIDDSSETLIKISSGDKQMSRIRFNVTSKNGRISLLDGRSLAARVIDSQNRLNGATTSNTLLITGNKDSSALTINYWYEDCKKDQDLICDNSTRCVPRDSLCKGKFYCEDGSDSKLVCNSTGPLPPPNNNHDGLGNFAVFLLSIFMLTLGIFSTLYGPGIYKALEDRFRSGQYSSFTSVE